MRYIYLSPLLIVMPLIADLNKASIEKMVEQIQNKRVSNRKVDFYKVPSPMAMIYHNPNKDKNSTKTQKPVLKIIEKRASFNLVAIINGQAYINGKWVGVGDIIDEFKVKEIKSNEVLLEKEQKRIYLFLPKKRKTNILQVSEVVK